MLMTADDAAETTETAAGFLRANGILSEDVLFLVRTTPLAREEEENVVVNCHHPGE